MALKDWKKIKTGMFLVFQKDDVFVTVWKPFRDEKIYTFAVGNTKHTIKIRKDFKTRKLAYKYAKTYMKKH